MTRDVALFAQYHPRGELPPHARHAIATLLDAGLTVHVACAADHHADADAPPADSRPLRDRGAVFHRRANGGLDFGSWQFLLRTGCAEGARRVLLVNDSTLGALRPLAPILDAMAPHPAWGMVASRQIRPHLQSWFVSLDGDILRHPALQRVFAQDFAAMSRDEIILHGEIGLSTALDAAGVPWVARWPHPRHRHGLRRVLTALPPANPAHTDWRRMLGDVPYLKLELLRSDPARLAPAAAWRAVLTELGYPLAWADAAIAAVPTRRGADPLNWRGRLAQRLARL